MVACFSIESNSNISLKYVWALVWLGFGVAISAALPLFFAYVLVMSNQRNSEPKGVSMVLVITEILALASLVLIPETSGKIFNYNIIFGHAIMMIPLFVGSSHSRQQTHFIQRAALYGFLAGIAFTYRILRIIILKAYHGDLTSSVHLWKSLAQGPLDISSIAERFVAFGWRHHAQSSISFDWVFITVECCLFFVFEGGFFGLLLALITPFVSVATTFPLFLLVEQIHFFRVSNVKYKDH
jgi:hypothetical protein